MSYELEQKQYAEELEKLTERYEDLKQFFSDNPDQKENKTPYLNRSKDFGRMQYEQILEKKYNYYDHHKYSTLYLEFLILAFRTSELENKLKQSKVGRSVEKTADFIGGITPQHVSGRIYKVEDGDGCSKFCLCFIIIDAVIIFLYWLISGGK